MHAFFYKKNYYIRILILNALKDFFEIFHLLFFIYL